MEVATLKLWKQLLLCVFVLIAAFMGWSWLYPGAHDLLRNNGLARISLFAPDSGKSISGQSASGKSARRNGGQGKPRGLREALVVVSNVGEGVVNDRLTAIGSGQAVRSVSVRTLVSGQIAAIPVQPGGRVARGDVLIALDAAEEELALERAMLTVHDAQARVERLESLVASRAVSSVEVDQARNTHDTARVAVRQAELELARRTVRAPISGSLGILAVNAGDYVTSQTEIASIDDRSEILIEFFVPERFASGMERGKKITAAAISRPGEVFSGEISVVDNRVDEASRTLRVRARIPNLDDSLRAGMSFEVHLLFDGERWPSVDPLAVQWDSAGAYVWRIIDGVAERVDVSIVQRNSDSVLVRADLAPGDAVVIEGVQSVRPGGAVRVFGDEADAGDGAAPRAPDLKAKTPQTGAPQAKTPQTGASQAQAPQAQAPLTGAPQAQAPQTGAPQTKAPLTGAPQTGAPRTGGDT